MSMIKVGKNITQSISASGTANGAAISMSKVYTFSAQVSVTLGAATGVTLCLQKSNDNVNWVNDGTPVPVASTGTYFLEKTPPTSLWMRIAYVVGTSTISATTILVTQEQY